MSSICVTLVMPVYNTDGELLRKCIESIKRQTCQRWNLLIIDDGSRKDVSDYCDTFTSDCKITVIHQRNSGVSTARNNGTHYASGDYVMYIDSDDVLLPYAIEDALQYAEKTDADIVFGGVVKIVNQEDCSCYYNSKGEFGINNYNKDELKKQILGSKVKGLYDIQGAGYIGRGPWAKLVKLDLAKNVLFPIDYPIGEDLIWSLRLVNSCNSFVVANSIWYGYVIYQSSAISKYYGNRETIVSKWFDLIRSENSEFFSHNKAVQGQLLTRELYSLIQYEILSSQKDLSMLEKNKYIKNLISVEPWSIIKYKPFNRDLSVFQKLLISCCRISIGATAVSFYLYLKNKLH